MNLKVTLAALLLALCLAPGARAMSLHDFGKMNDDDDAGYVALLVEKSAEYLKAQGHPDQAQQLIAFFKTPGRDGGTFRLADQLKQAYQFNTLHATNPNNRVPERQVEDALSITLSAQGFTVPAKYLLTAGKSFRADGPPRTITVSPSINHPY